MRHFLRLTEAVSARIEFLEAAEIWAADMQNDDYESNKGMIEEDLLRRKRVAAPYRTVPPPGWLFRGTGLPAGQAEALARGEKVAIDLSESLFSSWSRDLRTAEGFTARYFDHFEGDSAAVLRIPAAKASVFLSFEALWEGMSESEQRLYPGIAIAAGELEVIVRHKPSFVITKADVASFHTRESLESDDKVPDDHTALSLEERRERLYDLALPRYPDKTPKEIRERIAALSVLQIGELLAAWSKPSNQ